MSKKKTHIERNVEKKAARNALKTKLENFIVLQTSIVLALGVLFAIFYNYYNSSLVGTMKTLFNVFIWAGVAAVLVFAILGYVKKNPSLYKWCAAGAANSVLWFLFTRFGRYGGHTMISGVAYCYYAIILYFIFSLVYYFLALKNAWTNKTVRIIFYVIAALVVLAYIISAVVFMYLGGNFTGFAK